jgi:hypothetical protein
MKPEFLFLAFWIILGLAIYALLNYVSLIRL